MIMTKAEPVHNSDPVMARLEDQIRWYDRKSRMFQKWFKVLKTVTIFMASLIPVLAGFLNSRYANLVASSLGGAVAIIEGVQQLNQFHANWIVYRATCEALKHEKYLYLATAGPYATAANCRLVLAERVELLFSQEQAKWSRHPEGTPSTP